MVAAAIIVIILIGVAFVTVGVAWINDAVGRLWPDGGQQKERNE